ncbi:MAG: DUF1844 domain-containing protein [Oligoflexus sp.]
MSEDKQSVEFSGLILGFCSAALSYMGYGDAVVGKNLELAKQNIDIIKLLKEKTHGNLSDEEQRLIDDAVIDLQRRFVEVSSGS